MEESQLLCVPRQTKGRVKMPPRAEPHPAMAYQMYLTATSHHALSKQARVQCN